MKTIVTTNPVEAASLIREGKLVAFPTETVYGLGAHALRKEAVRAIFDAKGRPADNPLIVHLARMSQLENVAQRVPDTARRLAERFMPGPLTLILPRRPAVPDVTTAHLSTVGVRVPRHETAHTFLKACAVPVAAPSANISGRPSPTSWETVRQDLEGRIAAILHGQPVEVGLESTVVDATSAPPLVLRAGAVPVERIREVVPNIQLADRDSTSSGEVRSPGARHRHYAPQAQVHLIEHPEAAPSTPDAAYIGLDTPSDDAFGRIAVCEDVDAYARRLFHFFRACDADELHDIYCQRVPPEGLGLALMDRLRRAADG